MSDDGKTRRMEVRPSDAVFAEFLARYQATVVVLSGRAQGVEHGLEQQSILIGRGPGADLSFEEDSMSREHAALEFVDGGYRLRDLGSTNGITVNDMPVKSSFLKHGDRFKLGEQELQYLLEKRESGPRVYTLADD
jgi:pSer/pThr/pTyr-binding forkhead associated (FHA) protein